MAEADEQLPAFERELSVDDILTCRHTAQRVLDASLAAASGMGEAMEDAAAAVSRARGRPQPPLPASVIGGVAGSNLGAAVAGAGAGPGMAAAATAAASPRSLAASSSAASSSAAGEPALSTSSGERRRRGYLAWGLSKAASFLRYMPYSVAGEVG